MVHREASSALVIYCFGPQNTQYINGVIERIVVDISPLGSSPLTDIILTALSCTIACHDKSKHICALRSAYSLAQCHKIHILSLQYGKCHPQPVFR